MRSIPLSISYHIEVMQSLSLSVNQPSSRVMLWSPSYYTAGHVSAEVIENYIQGQQMKMKYDSCSSLIDLPEMTIDFKDWHTIIKNTLNHKKLFIHKPAG
jgi:hypothetical protein